MNYYSEKEVRKVLENINELIVSESSIDDIINKLTPSLKIEPPKLNVFATSLPSDNSLSTED